MVQDLTRLAVAQWREGAELGVRRLLGFRKAKRDRRKRKNKDKKGGKEQASAMEVDSIEQPTRGDQTLRNDVSKEENNESPMGQVIPIWHSLPGKLDPEMRVTSWFMCTRCTHMDPRYKRMRVLDFRGLCSHECSQKDWGRANSKKWSIDCFTLAPRAIETAKRMLEILGLDAEDPGTTTTCLKGWWACDNCPARMSAMVWEDLLRHCQRHEHQNISQVSDEEAQNRKIALNFKSKRLSFADLLSGKYEVEAKTKQLACVHCRPSINATSHPNLSKTEKVMDIHGIRQHMRAKHKVEDCRNEDYYYVTEDKVQRFPADG
ncbi:hypothetical protein M408DRAFT_28941 [Serendipita vermifera MAFF 305830]|uniref:Uncharacterized protein n=1 Tax=Serendipita vermifera MAFF 305830 TaxID=933852 RepID=A0A0C3AS99_SERVB|nr:hypothetical protein M408DRAFT_28941 [Serendipita vermifera MAFF 305830]